MPNAKVLESKKAVVEALSGKIKEATSVVFVVSLPFEVGMDVKQAVFACIFIAKEAGNGYNLS